MLLKQFKKLVVLSLTGVLIVIILNLLTVAPPHKPQSNNLVKGVWLTHLGNSFLTYTTAIDNVFHQLSLLNFNRVYISVYNKGTIYPSEYALRNHQVSLPWTDPLSSTIKQGKRQGLKIYAWYEYGMMLNKYDKLAQKHPDWLLKTDNGTQLINNNLWLNPGNPEVEQYWINLLTEVAEKYPELDGIQLDDHWGIPKAFGNKRLEMNNLTKKVVEAVRKVNSNLIISVSPNPYHFAVKNYNQDWIKWVKEKLVDEIIIQIYRPTATEVARSLTDSGIKTAHQYIPVGVGIYTGNFWSRKSLTEIAEQVSVVKKYNYGYSLFCWEYLFTPLHNSSRQEREAVFKVVNF
ncbi:MAG: family 10 glycosylhydrolase [Xenococcaceae cyanobacterium MO_207.B15]|nr:family 10 glycosylhydrolase [Xenococcaceae cyanobacterium MO_207.B15]MDJ0744787.1 family 10 glycosylhydrolase [Xenococcaceae cyanobacterium MO_167.B27]